MKTYIYSFLLLLSFNLSIAQLSVNNNAYIFVDGNGFNSSTPTTPNAPLFVTDDIRIGTTSEIFLRNEAQILQGSGTTGNSGRGTLSLYQEGTVDNYAYNYWSTPVGNVNTDVNNNNPFKSDASIINDIITLTTSTPATMIGGSDGFASPLAIAKRWIYSYSPGTLYADWDFAGEGQDVGAGYGFSMKGSTNSNSQQYDFKGKPNTGIIQTAVLAGQFTLVGNPYPSALDALSYIHDPTNQSRITGTLYFWDHDLSVNSHQLDNYVGGYATYTISADGNTETFNAATYRATDTDGLPTGAGSSALANGKRLKRYIPVGQGFMIEGVSGGTARFTNDQRVYYKGSDLESEFFRTNNSKNKTSNSNSNKATVSLGAIEYNEQGLQILPEGLGLRRFRLNIDFDNEIRRPLVYNLHPDATPGFDYGLESNYTLASPKDSYFVAENVNYVAQAQNYDIELRIPLIVKTDTNTALRISIFDVQQFGDESIYLYDKIEDVYYDLTVLNFETNLETGTYTNRFEITFKDNDSLTLDQLEETNFTVFQNNTQSQLIVANPEALNILSIALVDVSGKQIFNKINLENSERYQFSTKNLSDGVYVASITLEDGYTKTKKVIITNK